MEQAIVTFFEQNDPCAWKSNRLGRESFTLKCFGRSGDNPTQKAVDKNVEDT